MSQLAAITLIILIIIAVAIPFILRSLLWSKVIKCLNKNEHDKALEIINSKAYVFLFSEYDKNWNTLRVYLSKDDQQMIRQTAIKLLNGKLNKSQAMQVAGNTYFYFLDRKDQEMSLEMLKQLRIYADKEQLEYDEMLYRIMIEDKYEDIEKIDDMIETLKTEKDDDEKIIQMGLLYYLMALMFKNKGDNAQKSKYAAKAKANLKGTPYMKRVKAIGG